MRNCHNNVKNILLQREKDLLRNKELSHYNERLSNFFFFLSWWQQYAAGNTHQDVAALSAFMQSTGAQGFRRASHTVRFETLAPRGELIGADFETQHCE